MIELNEKGMIRISDGLSQDGRAIKALSGSYVPLVDLDWLRVLELIREYARVVQMDGLFAGQELALAVLLLSIDTENAETRRALEKESGANNLLRMLMHCERGLQGTQSAAGAELGALLKSLMQDLRST